MEPGVRESCLRIVSEDLEEGALEAYPYPALIRTGRMAEKEYPLLEIGNRFLTLTVAPSLGGRVLALADQRSGISLPRVPEKIEAEAGSRRKAHWPHGIQLVLDGQERLTSLGPVESMYQQDEDEAQILLAESATYPLSWHLSLTLGADSAEIELEARIYNRSLQSVLYNGGLCWPAALGKVSGGVVWDPGTGGGLAVQSDSLKGLYTGDGLVFLTRFHGPRSMAPHQLDTWKARLIPCGGFRGLPRVSGQFVAAFDSSEAAICSTTESVPVKLVILSGSGETLEANLDASVGEILRVPFGELGPKEVVILDQAKNELFRCDPCGTPPVFEGREPVPTGRKAPVPSLDWPRQVIEDAGFSMANRAVSEYLLGVLDLRERKFGEAATRFEQSLSFNAEDHLAWWLKALSIRHSGTEEAPGPELPNAHYLAPMEPALRVESLLSQPIEGGFEANPLLALFAEHREAAIDVGCQLLEAKLFADAVRFLDEVRRHGDFPMLRYLLAYAYLIGRKMEAEAAQQIQVAGKMGAEPPYPVRQFEKVALSVLRTKFSTDTRLCYYAELASGPS